MQYSIHPTALVDANAQLEENVVIGPYCIIGAEVKIGANTKVGALSTITGDTKIGSDCRIFSHTAIGGEPQDLKYKGENTVLVIGNHNTIREFVTINRGTVTGRGQTTIGNHNFIMAYTHIAHDCQIGNYTILANATTLAGHIQIFDYAVIGGLAAIQQFCRIGRYAFIGGTSGVVKDIIPFVKASGSHSKLFGLNVVGLKRRGVSRETIKTIKKAYRILFQSQLNTSQALARIDDELEKIPEIIELIEFIQSSKVGICK